MKKAAVIAGVAGVALAVGYNMYSIKPHPQIAGAKPATPAKHVAQAQAEPQPAAAASAVHAAAADKQPAPAANNPDASKPADVAKPHTATVKMVAPMPKESPKKS